MSAYSDWKCGALTDDEYRDHCNWEARRDEYYEDMMFSETYEDEDYDKE